MFSNNIRKITLTVSLLLHLILVLSYKSLSHIRLFANDHSAVENTKQEKQIVFELVETPDDARTEQPPDNANLLSDKNSIARDQYRNNDLYPGSPYSRGDWDIKNLETNNLADDEGQQNNPLNNEAFEKNNEEPLKELEASIQSYDNQKFSRQALLGKSGSSQRTLNKPKYNSEEFSADEIGGLTFNTYNWNFAPYMLDMKRKIERNIFPPPAFTHMGLINGETILRFKVMPNGEVRDLQVLNYKGHKSLMETSVKAVENSSAFKPLPADFPENYLEVTASFTYMIGKN